MRSQFAFFNRQHTGMKILFTLLTVFFSVYLPVSKAVCIWGILALYYCLDKSFWPAYMHIFLRLLPFFISYFLMGIFFSLDFFHQAHAALRICVILSLSAYLIISTPPQRVFQDAGTLLRFPLFRDACVFFAATISFVPLFQDAYRTVPTDTSLLSRSLQAIQHVFENLSTIQTEVYAQLDAPVSPRNKTLIPNLCILFASAAMIILFSFLR